MGIAHVAFELGPGHQRGDRVYCHHVERESKRCGLYANRPVVCRAYDCRKDKRIWEDFENRVVSPDLEKLFPQRAAEEGGQTLYQLTRTPAQAAHAEGA